MPVVSSQNALVLAPHPDDETLGCGGTIKLITSAGGNVDVVLMTRGERGVGPGESNSLAEREQLARRRTAEAERACAILGVRRLSFLDGPDTQLQSHGHLWRNIAQTIEAGGYRSVYCPWPFDGHVDHQATFAMFRLAVQAIAREIDVWLYEVWTPQDANIRVAVDATMAAKMLAVQEYQSQLAVYDYAGGFEALARYRNIFNPTGRYAEAFFNCDSESLLRGEGLPWQRSEMQLSDPL